MNNYTYFPISNCTAQAQWFIQNDPYYFSFNKDESIEQRAARYKELFTRIDHIPALPLPICLGVTLWELILSDINWLKIAGDENHPQRQHIEDLGFSTRYTAAVYLAMANDAEVMGKVQAEIEKWGDKRLVGNAGSFMIQTQRQNIDWLFMTVRSLVYIPTFNRRGVMLKMLQDALSFVDWKQLGQRLYSDCQ